jgi:hypothetical protein
MHLLPLMTTLLLSLITTATADFFISNTTVCQGLPRNCPRGAQVITSASSNYSCDALVPAQDNAYLRNGTIGPFGDWNLWTPNVCDFGKLKFLRKWEGNGYDVQDEAGNAQGECTEAEDELIQTCDLWIIALMFRTMYRCSSPVCG